MKQRIATFLILLLTFTTISMTANEPVPASKAVSQSIAEFLQNKIDYPDFARTNDFECHVLIRLEIKEDGSFKIDCANCKNERLKMHVKDSIEKLVSEDYVQYAGQTVSLKVVFKLIS